VADVPYISGPPALKQSYLCAEEGVGCRTKFFVKRTRRASHYVWRVD
jgi:hypothetical protein